MRLRPVVLTIGLMLAGSVFTVLGVSRTYTGPVVRAENPIVVTGEVIRIDAGKIVVMRPDGQEVTYVLAPGVTLPKEVQVGREVNLRTEAGPDGAVLVRQVTTTAVTPDGQVKRTTEVTRTQPSGATTTTTTTTTGAVTGEVIRLEPGKALAIRSKNGETTYTLPAGTVVPAEVQVGSTATVQFVPGPNGTSMVKRVTTTTVGTDGQVREKTDITRTEPGGRTSRASMTTLKGTVAAYVPGKSITVTDANGARVTYVLGATSQLPSDILMGKEVTIQVPADQAGVTYEVEREGDLIKIKAKPKQD